MANRATILKQKFQNSVALPFEQVLSEAVMQQVLEEQGISYRQTLYTPIVVLWAWLSQVLDADKSLSNAVNRVVAWIAAAGEEVPSSDTGAYSKARCRLPLAVLKPLLQRTAAGLTSQVKPEQWWCGRRVKAYDGTTVLMSDTPANQKAYPQHSNQKTGCGFPLAKLVVWFCGTTGAVLEVAIAAFNTSEWQLSRQLYATLQPEDVVVADSAYGTYVDLALVRCAKADAVFRKHHARQCDFRRGKRLGIGDHIVQWQRPLQCPPSMSSAEFETLPATLEVREVHLLIQQPGFRSKEIILVTTLVDPKRYPKAKERRTLSVALASHRSQPQTSQNHFEDGDDLCQNPRNGAKGNLDAFASVQLAANLDVASCPASSSVTFTHFLTGHSATVQSVQASVRYGIR